MTVPVPPAPDPGVPQPIDPPTPDPVPQPLDPPGRPEPDIGPPVPGPA